MSQTEISTNELTRMTFAVRECVADKLLTGIDKLQLHAYYDNMCQHMAYTLTAEVMAEKLVEDTATAAVSVSFTHPATWWDHLKRDHGHKWWCPSGYRDETVTKERTASLTFERYATFPYSTIKFPELGVATIKEMTHR